LATVEPSANAISVIWPLTRGRTSTSWIASTRPMCSWVSGSAARSGNCTVTGGGAVGAVLDCAGEHAARTAATTGDSSAASGFRVECESVIA
jgi:hypothetical protein